MKKWIVGLLVVMVAMLGFIYLGIPKLIRVNVTMPIDAPAGSFMRSEFDEINWRRWWPGEQISAGDSGRSTLGLLATYRFNNINYTPEDKKINIVILRIGLDADTALSLMNFIRENSLSVRVEWDAAVSASLNPFTRVRQWFRVKDLKKDMQLVLDKLQEFYKSERNIYGINIVHDFMKDTMLVSTFVHSDTYPTNEQVYHLIDQVKDYAVAGNAVILGNPMLNISREEGEADYIVRVAVPVNKRLPRDGNTSYRLMPAGVRILTADVTGGMYSADQALKQLDYFAADHNYKLPAIPFFSLLTDRRAQADTSKWVTRIYYPIMN